MRIKKLWSSLREIAVIKQKRVIDWHSVRRLIFLLLHVQCGLMTHSSRKHHFYTPSLAAACLLLSLWTKGGLGHRWRVSRSIQWQEAVIQTDRHGVSLSHYNAIRVHLNHFTARRASCNCMIWSALCIDSYMTPRALCSLPALIASGSAISSTGHVYYWRRNDEFCATVGPVFSAQLVFYIGSQMSCLFTELSGLYSR